MTHYPLLHTPLMAEELKNEVPRAPGRVSDHWTCVLSLPAPHHQNRSCNKTSLPVLCIVRVKWDDLDK